MKRADPPRIVLVVTPEDPEFLDRAHETLLELARDDARAKGNPDPVSEDDYRGVTGYSLSDDEAHAIIDGRLVIANGQAALKAVIDRTIDDGDRLVDDAFFNARQPEDAPMAWAYARLDRLREIDPDRFGGDDEPDAGEVLLFGGWLELIRSAPWASATWEWADDRLSATLKVAAPEGRSEAMSRFFPPEGQGAARPIDFEGRVATVNLWRDMGAIWDVREEILLPEALQGLAQLDTFAGQFFGGRDFGDSVLEPLGDQWQLVAADQDYDAMDPEPTLKLPAFALVVDLDADRPEFGQRLRVTFQSLLGLVNLGAAQSGGGPPLMLGSETFDGVAISTSRYMPAPGEPEDDEAEVHLRHNFSPSVAEVDGRFILSSSTALARTLIGAIRSAEPRDPTDATLLMTADGPALAGLVDRNREQLILRNMLEQGNDREAAEQSIAVLSGLLRYLGQGTLRVVDGDEASTLALEFAIGDRD